MAYLDVTVTSGLILGAREAEAKALQAIGMAVDPEMGESRLREALRDVADELLIYAAVARFVPDLLRVSTRSITVAAGLVTAGTTCSREAEAAFRVGEDMRTPKQSVRNALARSGWLLLCHSHLAGEVPALVAEL